MMKRYIVIPQALFLFFMLAGCDEFGEDYGHHAAAGTVSDDPEDKEFPEFPLYYTGTGVFFNELDPTDTLIGIYTYDMEEGVNHEIVHWVDRTIVAIMEYDLEGDEPDREYWIDLDEKGRPTDCELAEFPLPNVFHRDWWLENDMVYEGTDEINGFAAHCWAGEMPEAGFPVRYCNRADVYPEFSPLLKQVAHFTFEDYDGRELEKSDIQPSLFKLPRECRDL